MAAGEIISPQIRRLVIEIKNSENAALHHSRQRPAEARRIRLAMSSWLEKRRLSLAPAPIVIIISREKLAADNVMADYASAVLMADAWRHRRRYHCACLTPRK